MGIPTVVQANTVQSDGLAVSGTGLISIEQQNLLAKQILQATQELESLLAGRTNNELLTRLEADSWCVAECLDHLTQTTRAFLPAIAKAIADAPKLKVDRRWRTGIFPSLFIRHLNPPYRIRFKVLPQLAPQCPDSGIAWARFVESQSELLASLSSTTGLAIDKVRINSPVYARFSYNIYGALRMLVAHQSRHIWQIRKILTALDRRVVA